MDHVLTGDEHIMYDGMPINYLLRDFWAWSSSDLLNNTLRGSFAEFLVCAACGLKATLLTPREDWSPYDVYYPLLPGKKGIRIEVKSAAYLQAWENDKLSRIQFSIRPTRAWSSSGGYEDAIRHQSDVYVFCVYANKDRASANPLVLDDWDFYVLSTLAISSRCGSQQSISLSALEDLGPRKVKFDGIEQAILECYKIPEFTPPRKMTNLWYQILCNLQKAVPRLLIPGHRLLYRLWCASGPVFHANHIGILKSSES